MEINKVTVELRPSLFGLSPEMILMPVGDVQHGAPGSNLEKMKRHIDWGMKHGAYFISMGDMVDTASPSERKALARAEFHDSTRIAMEEKAEEKYEQVEIALIGTDGRWLGWHRGHHFWEFSSGYTTDQRLARRFGGPSLNWLSMLTIKFEGSKLQAKILSTHGSGSSSTMLGPLAGQGKRLLDSWPMADVVLIGHHSRKVGYPLDVLEDPDAKIKARRRIVTLTGGFCQGYLEGSTTYVEEALMPPLNQGAPIIFIRPMDSEKRLDMSLLT